MEKELDIIASQIVDDGECHIQSSFYVTAERDLVELQHFQGSYAFLERDEKFDYRFRSHSKYRLEGGTMTLQTGGAYSQSKEYNFEDGGVERHFQQVSEQVLGSAFFQSVLAADREIALQTGLLDETKPITVGLHQVRYAAVDSHPSWASPSWFHQDDETVVFIHLVALSANAIGGDLIIRRVPSVYSKVISMKAPMETLVVSQKNFHAVTPIGVGCGQFAYRDILLVTFHNAA